jgi:hypothetical protein
MASTIKLKNGSGAPTTGDLVQGEPALDLTNKRLYTENASGVVIEVGVNPTSITTGNITANGTINLTGATVSNAGSITTADINGGTIDGTVIGGTTAAAITGTTITGTSFVSSGDMTFEDNDKAVFGDGSDLRIYHTGSHSTIENIGTGHLQIHTTDFRLRNSAGTESMILANADGNVQLFYDNAEKLATTATGIDVTGTVTADGLSLDNAQYINFKNSSNVSTRSLGINVANTFYIGGIDADIGDILFVDGGATRASFANGGDISFYEDTGTTAKLFWDASEERLGIGTTSPSVDLDVEGTAQVNLLEVTHDADRAVNFVKTGANTFSIEHDVNQFYFWNQTTSESPLLFQNDGDVIMNGGNVGIGTSSPSAPLHVFKSGGSTTSINVALTLDYESPTASLAGSGTAILFKGKSGGGNFAQYDQAMISTNNIGSNNSHGLSFFYKPNAATALTEGLTLDEEGNVGIGTSTPSTRLEVGSGVSSETIKVNAGSGWADLTLNSGSSNGGSIYWNDGADAGQLFYYHVDDSMRFHTATTERMRIDASGNVGINATTIAANGLQIGNTSSTDTEQLYLYTNKAIFSISTDGATNGAGTTINYSFANGGGGPLKFTTASGEVARLDASGNLLVGTTDTVIWNDTSGEGVVIGPNAIQVARASDVCLLLNRQSTDGVVQAFASRGVQVGDITVSVSSTAYNTSSDQRLKENITDANDAGSKIDAIKVRQYDWKADGSHQDYGMVAQELMTVAPEAVSVPEDPEKMMGVDYSKLVPMLIKEVQSLRARVAQLEGAN